MVVERARLMYATRLQVRLSRLPQWLAWHLPRWLVMWCYIRVVAHATTGQEYGGTVPTDLNVMEALRRWDARADL